MEMTIEQKMEKLMAAGAKRWQKNEMDRLYINCDLLGYEYEKYNTGNVCSAWLNGERISNSEMYRVLAA